MSDVLKYNSIIYKATQLHNPRGSEFQIPNICNVQIQTTNTAEVKEEDYEYDYELEPVVFCVPPYI